MKRILLRLGDYVFVMRPLILVPAWSFFLLGAAAGSRQNPMADTPASLYYGFACLTAILVTAYLLNQIFDLESDRRNLKGHFLTRGIFKVRTVLVMAMVAFLFASYLFRSVGAAQRTPLVLALALSLAYSLPPLRLVARPFVDLLANAVGYGGVAYVTGYVAYDASIARAADLALPYVFFVGATFLHTTILDIDGDRNTDKTTTSVLIGVRASAVLACVLTVAGLFPAVLSAYRVHGEKSSLVILSIGLVVFVYAATRLLRTTNTSASSNAVQVVTVVVTITAAVAWPVYLALLVPIVVSARYYYRARFGLSYPGPAPPNRLANDV
jgi:4-hydroxybenzoate polyprenyltransferase